MYNIFDGGFMGVLNIINSCKSEQQLYKFIKYRLEKCIQMGEEANEGLKFIGDNVDINPNIPLDNSDGNYDVNVFWDGFIPPDVRIVYGVLYPLACNGGYYYYMDDFDYIIEFVKYIKGVKLNRESDLIAYVHQFLRNYYIKPLEENRREFVFALICNSNGWYYPPTKERSIGDFKGRSLARCTEFAATAQNIMSFMGLDTYYVHDKNHSYNVVSFKGEKPAIVDYSKGVLCENLITKSRKVLPYIFDLEEDPNEFVGKISESDYRIECNEYAVYIEGNMYFQQKFKKTRSYGAGGITPQDKKVLSNMR